MRHSSSYTVNRIDNNNELDAKFACCASNHRTPQYLAAAAVTVGGFSLGTVLGWSSPALPNLKNSEDFEDLEQYQLSWIGSLVTIGALIGASCGGYSIEKIGRKTTLLALGIPFVTGWLTIALSHHVLMLYCGRFLTGFSVGVLSVSAPVYLCEISQSDIRGFLGAVFQVTVTLGILFTYVVGSMTSWNLLAGWCAVIPLVFTILSIFLLKESPRWLLAEGRTNEAIQALSWLRSSDSLNPSQSVLDEIDEIQATLQRTKEFQMKYMDLLTIPILKPILVTLGLMFFNQLSGQNAVVFYTVKIFKEASTGANAHLSSIIVAAVQVIATALACAFVDRAGRRILLLSSFAVMSISLVTLGGYFYMKAVDGIHEAAHWIPLVSVVAFNAAYCGGVGCLIWTVMSEILPNHVIGFASGLATTFNWTLAFLTTRFFQDFNDTLGIQNTFWLFAAACVVGMAFIYAFVPETTGKSLDTIQMESFGQKSAHSVEDITSVTRHHKSVLV